MNTDKQNALNLLLLLSALESWSFSMKAMLPDYLHEALDAEIDRLRKVVLE